MNKLNQFDEMPFGKYKGELIGTVIEDDPQYIYWAINQTSLRIDEPTMKYLKENMT